MANILQTTFSKKFLYMKIFTFDFQLPWSLLPGANWCYRSIGLDNGLVLNKQQAIILTSRAQIGVPYTNICLSG